MKQKNKNIVKCCSCKKEIPIEKAIRRAYRLWCQNCIDSGIHLELGGKYKRRTY